MPDAMAHWWRRRDRLGLCVVIQVAGIIGLQLTAAMMEDIQLMELRARELINRKAGGT